jgi:hypothetical protein
MRPLRQNRATVHYNNSLTTIKQPLVLLVFIPVFVSAQQNMRRVLVDGVQLSEKKIKKRVEYFKSNPIFVTQLTIDPEVIESLDPEEIEELRHETHLINKNIRTAFMNFWDINKEILFITDTELKAKEKKFKGAIFFDLFNIGNYIDDDGQADPIPAFALIRPNSRDYLNDVVPRHGMLDTSLVDVVTELRLLKLNVITGNVWNTRDLGSKTILIDKDEPRSIYGADFVESIQTKYKDSIVEADYKFLLDVIMRRDPKYIYIRDISIINAEDGAMIPVPK